jgi:hypothetical protein
MATVSRYTVKWEIIVNAVSRDEAARKAVAVQRDRSSTAMVFDVRRETEGLFSRVDLAEVMRQRVLKRIAPRQRKQRRTT